MAIVQYFLSESNSETVLAVVSEKPHHLLQIAGEEDEHTVIPVDCVLEKIL